MRSVLCAAAVLVALGGLSGCAARHPQAAAVVAAGAPRVALVPLENLSAQAQAGERMTRIVFAALARTGCCEMIEPGVVDRALEGLRIRDAASLAPEQIRSLGDTLAARYVLLGSVIENGNVRTPDGDVPAVGLTLRLVETTTAKVAWADMRFRSGEDRETLFGWGRRRDGDRLAAEVADEMVRGLGAGIARSSRTGGTP